LILAALLAGGGGWRSAGGKSANASRFDIDIVRLRLAVI
jgi:hypothetical protein